MTGRLLSVMAVVTACSTSLHAQVQDTASGDPRVAAALDYYRGVIERGVVRQVVSTPTVYEVVEPGTGCLGVFLGDCFGGVSCAWYGSFCNSSPYSSARAEVIRRLTEVAKDHPTDGPLVGMIANFHVQQYAWEDAERVANACGTGWWCQTLRGFVRHQMYAGRGSMQFDSALISAPTGILAFGVPKIPVELDRGLRCEWLDVGLYLTGAFSNQYSKEKCGDRTALVERFWWLADPMWSVPGNARRDEQISRMIALRLLDDEYRTTKDIMRATTRLAVWPMSHHEDVARLGFYNSWKAVTREGAKRLETRPQLYVNGGYSFTPRPSTLSNPMLSDPEDWAVEWGKGAERMITRERWYNLESYQLGFLRRADGLLAVAAAAVPAIAPSLENMSGALALGDPADFEVAVIPMRPEGVGVLRGQGLVAVRNWIASIEAAGPGWASRARFGAPVQFSGTGLEVSQPLMTDRRFGDGRSIAESLLPTTQITADAQVGIYFELYGVQPGEPLRVRIRERRTNGSILDRLKVLLGGSSGGGLDVEFTESGVPDADGIMKQYYELTLSGLDPGLHEIEVEVEAGGKQATSRARRIEILSAGR